MVRNKSITLMSAGHACVDVYQGSVTALVPFFVAERAYTYAAASGIVLAASLLSSVAQPLFGAMTDRRAMPWLLPLSTLLAGTGIALSGLTGSYALTLAFVAVSGIGVAAYHPESARVARVASGGSHSGMGWFSLGGNTGFALAPLMVAAVMAVGGLRYSPLLVVPALVGSVLCLPVLRTLERTRADARGTAAGSASEGAASEGAASEGTAPEGAASEGAAGAAAVGGQAPAGQDDVASFVKLSLAVVCRSVVFVGMSTFVAFQVREQTGGGTTAGTVALCILYAGGAVGTVTGSHLAGRWKRVAVVRAAYLASVAAVAGVVLVPGPAVYLLVGLMSMSLYVPFSLQVTLAQDYLPTRVGTASGVTLGLMVSVGGMTSPVIGRIADATSLRVALAPLIVLPLLSWLLFRTLPEPSVQQNAVTPPTATAGPATSSAPATSPAPAAQPATRTDNP